MVGLVFDILIRLKVKYVSVNVDRYIDLRIGNWISFFSEFRSKFIS